jgi:hypothetical protein
MPSAFFFCLYARDCGRAGGRAAGRGRAGRGRAALRGWAGGGAGAPAGSSGWRAACCWPARRRRPALGWRARARSAAYRWRVPRRPPPSSSAGRRHSSSAILLRENSPAAQCQRPQQRQRSAATHVQLGEDLLHLQVCHAQHVPGLHLGRLHHHALQQQRRGAAQRPRRLLLGRLLRLRARLLLPLRALLRGAAVLVAAAERRLWLLLAGLLQAAVRRRHHLLRRVRAPVAGLLLLRLLLLSGRSRGRLVPLRRLQEQVILRPCWLSLHRCAPAGWSRFLRAGRARRPREGRASWPMCDCGPPGRRWGPPPRRCLCIGPSAAAQKHRAALLGAAGPHLRQLSSGAGQLVPRGQQLRVLQALQPTWLGMVSCGSARSGRFSGSCRAMLRSRVVAGAGASAGAGAGVWQCIRSVPGAHLCRRSAAGRVSSPGTALRRSRGGCASAAAPLRAASRHPDCANRGDAGATRRWTLLGLTCWLPATELDSQLEAAACYLCHSAQAAASVLQLPRRARARPLAGPAQRVQPTPLRSSREPRAARRPKALGRR